MTLRNPLEDLLIDAEAREAAETQIMHILDGLSANDRDIVLERLTAMRGVLRQIGKLLVTLPPDARNRVLHKLADQMS